MKEQNKGITLCHISVPADNSFPVMIDGMMHIFNFDGCMKVNDIQINWKQEEGENYCIVMTELSSTTVIKMSRQEFESELKNMFNKKWNSIYKEKKHE